MISGTVTFLIESETEEQVQDAIEKIESAVADTCFDLVYNVSQDIWDSDEK